MNIFTRYPLPNSILKCTRGAGNIVSGLLLLVSASPKTKDWTITYFVFEYILTRNILPKSILRGVGVESTYYQECY